MVEGVHAHPGALVEELRIEHRERPSSSCFAPAGRRRSSWRRRRGPLGAGVGLLGARSRCASTERTDCRVVVVEDAAQRGDAGRRSTRSPGGFQQVAEREGVIRQVIPQLGGGEVRRRSRPAQAKSLASGTDSEPATSSRFARPRASCGARRGRARARAGQAAPRPAVSALSRSSKRRGFLGLAVVAGRLGPAAPRSTSAPSTCVMSASYGAGGRRLADAVVGCARSALRYTPAGTSAGQSSGRQDADGAIGEPVGELAHVVGKSRTRVRADAVARQRRLPGQAVLLT